MSTQSFNPDSYKNGQEQEWDIAAPINAMVNGQPQDRQTELWGMITDAARELSNSGGSISMPNETILVAGRRE